MLGPTGPPRSDKKEQFGAHSARAKDAAGQEAGEVQQRPLWLDSVGSM